MKTFDSILTEIAENINNGYETAVLGKNNIAVKYGFLIENETDLPDLPENCELVIWNNEEIDNILNEFILIQKVN